jgi:hypothetical protein
MTGIRGRKSCTSRLIAAAMILSLATPAPGQDQPVSKPPQAQWDSTGKGAVRCIWMLYLIAQGMVTECGWQRTPSDDAMEQAILDIDEFILANASERPTRAGLQDYKRRMVEEQLNGTRQAYQKRFCEIPFIDRLRNQSPNQIREGTKDLLSIPREPVLNPCL